jgi:hypothetical protein
LGTKRPGNEAENSPPFCKDVGGSVHPLCGLYRDKFNLLRQSLFLRVKTHIQPAACDLIRGNKEVDLFPRIKSQAAGRAAPLRSAVCVFLPLDAPQSTRNSLQFNYF